MMARADILRLACLACAMASAVVTASPVIQAPAAMTTAAVMSAKADRAAVLAMARAGQRLVTAGERGTILLSDDNGQRWRQAKVPVRASLTALQFIDARRGWAVGHFGVVLRTDDGGESWSLQLDGVRAAQLALTAAGTAEARSAAKQLVQDGPDKPLLALHFSNAQEGMVVGAYNLALRTTDGGQSWTYIGHDLPNPKRLHLYGIAARDQQVTVVGEQGLLMSSDNGGRNFRALEQPYPGSYFGALSPAADVVLAFGLRGTAYRSENGGQAWLKADVPVNSALGAGLLLSDGRVLLAGQGGELLMSSDQGRSFTRLPGLPAPLAAVAQAANGNLVLGTLRGPVVMPLPR